jgi:hypothetical protein
MFTKDKVAEALKRLVSSLLALTVVAGPVFADETATLTIKNIPNVSVRMYGFIENDVINDSTQGFTEEMDNNLVAKAGNAAGTAQNYAGTHHRTIMSVRNSRLGFDVTMPKTEDGLATEGVFELDFLGNQGIDTTPGAAVGAQTERNYFNNPTVRVRHAYVNLTYNDAYNAKIGQYWSLLGWQPYYFPSEAIVQPAVGQLYRRFPQVRLMDTLKVTDDWTLESAIDAAKPADFNSAITDFHAGLRLASTKYKAASGIGSGTPLVGLSAALSGVLIPVRTTVGSSNGSAVALDALVPIIPSSDGKTAGNTMSLTGEYSNGRGIGGLELAGATAGVPTPTAANLTSASGDTNGLLDSGIAGIVGGTIDLIHFQTYRGDLTYVYPNSKWSNSAGYADVETLNMSDYGGGAGLAPHMQYYYVNGMYMPLSWLRFALELAQTKDTYNDPNNRYAYNTRIQFTTYITF